MTIGDLLYNDESTRLLLIIDEYNFVSEFDGAIETITLLNISSEGSFSMAKEAMRVLRWKILTRGFCDV
jgi:hypothetical protein